MITSQQVQELRVLTSSSMMDCKKALEEAAGDMEKAFNILKSKGKLIAEKKSARSTNAGLIASYVHSNGKIGVLLELRSETDFVSRNPEFSVLAHDLCLHIAAAKPTHIKEEDVPANVLEDEKNIFQEEFIKSGKLEKIVQQMVKMFLQTFWRIKKIFFKGGKIQKHLDENESCLLRQSFVKNPDQTIKELMDSYIAKFGENIEIGKFVRYEI